MFNALSTPSDCVNAMCEFSAETPSDGDEDEHPAYQNMNNALMDALSNYLCSGLLVSCLTDEELARVSLPCHFAMDFLCDNWNWVFCAPVVSTGCERRKRPSEQSPCTSCHCLDIVQLCLGDHDILPFIWIKHDVCGVFSALDCVIFG